MKLILKSVKPRNPYAMAAVRRKAGTHQRAAGARRQQAQRALRLEVERLKPSP